MFLKRNRTDSFEPGSNSSQLSLHKRSSIPLFMILSSVHTHISRDTAECSEYPISTVSQEIRQRVWVRISKKGHNSRTHRQGPMRRYVMFIFTSYELCVASFSHMT